MSDLTIAPSAKDAALSLKDAGVDLHKVDGSVNSQRNNSIEPEEIIHYVFNQQDWEKYAPAIQKLSFGSLKSLPIPLDRAKLPAKRIQEIADKARAKVAVPRDHPDYCNQFARAFFEVGQLPFTGLGWTKPVQAAAGGASVEMTAAEAYEEDTKPGRSRKGDTETLYMILTAFREAGKSCKAEAVGTQDHVYARSGTVNMDPSEKGTVGWEKTLTDAEITSKFFSEKAWEYFDKGRYDEGYDSMQVASLIDANNKDASLFWADEALQDGKTEDVLAFLSSAIHSNPQDIQTYYSIHQTLMEADTEEKKRTVAEMGGGKFLLRALAIALEDNEYALLPLVISLPSAKSLEKEAKAFRSKGYPWQADILMALAAQEKGETEAAKKYAEAANKQKPSGYASQVLSNVMLDEGNFAQAILHTEQSFQALPNLAGNHAALSDIYFEQGKIPQAYDEAVREQNVFSGNIHGLNALARAAAATGRMEEAVGAAEEYIVLEPKNYEAHLALALVLTIQGKFDTALKRAQYALSLADFNEAKASCHALIVEIAVTIGDLKLAKRHAEAAKRLGNDIAAIPYLIADNKPEDALRIAQAQVKEAPHSPYSWSSLAQTQYMAGKTREAASSVQATLQRNPGDYGALGINIWLAIESGEKEAAKVKLEDFRSMFGTSPDFHAVDALFSYALGQTEYAKTKIALALKRDPQDPNALLARARISLDAGEAEEAVKDIQTILKRHPKDGQAHALLALAHHKQKKSDLAETEARKAVEFYPFDNGLIESFSPYRTLIQILEERGKLEEAAKFRKKMEQNRQ